MTNMVPQIKPRELAFIKSPEVIAPIFELDFIKFVKAMPHLVKVGNFDIKILSPLIGFNE